MPRFPHSPSEKPDIRLLLLDEVMRNEGILLPAIQYLQCHARIKFAIVLLQESLIRSGPRFKRILENLGLEHVFVNQTSADYHGGGKIRIPIARMREMVLLSQRRIALDVDGKRKIPPNWYEFAQACGKDLPVAENDPSDRFGSVEMVSGFPSDEGQQVCSGRVMNLINAIAAARWAQRVTREQLSSPESTGRLFGYCDERPL